MRATIPRAADGCRPRTTPRPCDARAADLAKAAIRSPRAGQALRPAATPRARRILKRANRHTTGIDLRRRARRPQPRSAEEATGAAPGARHKAPRLRAREGGSL